MARFSLLVGLAATLTLTACSKDDGGDTGGDDATSADGADGTGADGTDGTDGTTATDPLFTAMEGEVAFTFVENGEALCDATVSLTGSDYGGDCEDCVFNFQLDSEVVSDAGTGCDYDDVVLGSMTHSRYERFLSFHFEYVYPGYYEDYTYTNYFQFGISWVEGGYPDVRWGFAGHDDSEFASAAVVDGTFSWTIDLAGTYYESDSYFGYCGPYSTYTASGAYTGGVENTEDIACDTRPYEGGDVFDLYISAEDAAAGNVQVSADTVREGTTGDLYMYIADEDRCLLSWGEDEHPCTYPPPDYACPSISESLAPGNYKLVVSSHEDCDDTTVEYVVSVTNGDLSLLSDDFEVTEYTVDWALRAAGSVSLTE